MNLTMRIANYEAIAEVYGATAARALANAVLGRLARLERIRCRPAADARLFEILLLDSDFPIDAATTWLLQSIGRQPFPVGRELLCVSPMIALGSEREGSRTSGGGGIGQALGPTARNYRDDMRSAAGLHEAWCADRFRLDWQPVKHASTDQILYYECLARIADRNGRWHSPAASISALERLGLTRALDLHVVECVIAKLAASTKILLAANISARSAVNDSWWHGVRQTLRDKPALACRLVLEITETAEFVSEVSAAAFVAEMRALGCTIVVDDFGAGHATLQRLVAIAPDAVKIDRSYIAGASLTSGALHDMAWLIRSLQNFCPLVIVEGVETRAQSEMIANAGAVWQQGYCHGRPIPYGHLECGESG